MDLRDLRALPKVDLHRHLEGAVRLSTILELSLAAAFPLRQRDRLVGFDIAGPEVGYPPARYRSLLEPLHGSGLGLTTHYGESGGPQYPKEAVEALGPSRLGHGLSVARDPAVIDLVI